MKGSERQKVWAFNGAPIEGRHSSFPSAVFSTVDTADTWITAHKLSGTLTSYILDLPAFERSLAMGTVSNRDQLRAATLRQVWTGGEEHIHYESGLRAGALPE